MPSGSRNESRSTWPAWRGTEMHRVTGAARGTWTRPSPRGWQGWAPCWVDMLAGLSRAKCGCHLEGCWDPPQGDEALPDPLFGPWAQGCVWALRFPPFSGPPSPCCPWFRGWAWGWGWGRRCQPTSSLAASVLPASSPPDSLSLQRRPQDSSNPWEEGPARVGSTRGEPTPTLPGFFHPLPPLPLCSLSLGLPLIFRAGRKHGRTSSFLSLPIRGGHHFPSSEPTAPVLDSDPRRSGEKGSPGSQRWSPFEVLVPCGRQLPLACYRNRTLRRWPLILHTRELEAGEALPVT